MTQKVCICGGGNLGHVCAGFLASSGDFDVALLTHQPESWQSTLTIRCPTDMKTLVGRLAHVSSNPADVIPSAEIILLCLPGYAIRQTLLDIREHLSANAAVGSVVSNTGFFFQAMDLLPKDRPCFGLQRVPFISRIEKYGQSARLLGRKEYLALAVEHSRDQGISLRQTVEIMFKTPVRLLSSHYEATLSNSNPLLHPARIHDLWRDWKAGMVYPRIPLFYEEWTDRAAQLYMDMDGELQTLLECLPVRHGSVPTVLDYYQSTDAASLAAKLRSIEAFKGIPAPMRRVAGGFIPDFANRYFTEDFPFGLNVIRRTAAEHAVPTPTMDQVANWWLAHATNASIGKT